MNISEREVPSNNKTVISLYRRLKTWGTKLVILLS